MIKVLAPFFLYFLYVAPDDGGIGGGGSPPPLDLADWIKRLEAAAKKERQPILEELARILGISVMDTVKSLTKAGWDPKKVESPGTDEDKNPPNAETQTVNLRHKTDYPSYRRAGLLLTKQFKPYEVTTDQLETFKTDPWVDIGE